MLAMFVVPKRIAATEASPSVDLALSVPPDVSTRLTRHAQVSRKTMSTTSKPRMTSSNNILPV